MHVHDRHRRTLPTEHGILCLFVASSVVLWSNSGAHAQPIRDMQELRASADSGDAEAQFTLGAMYYDGLGVARNEKEAAKWYRKAANQGNAAAQFKLGQMYEYGLGVRKDEKDAVAWYRKAADQGNSSAQVNLGRMYNFGRGVLKDERQAVAWLRKAADQGLAQAQFNLGVMYANGTGVQRTRNWPSHGTAKPPTRATRDRSSFSARCTSRAPACPKTTSLLTCGATSPRPAVMMTRGQPVIALNEE